MKRAVISTVIASCLASTLCAENWPQFRGPMGQGRSQTSHVPVEWSDKHNVAWKATLPGLGWSSPIVWNDRVFVTTATDDGTRCHILSLDRGTGDILWNTVVLTQKAERKEGKNSYATPTPVTDGHRVYAVFGDGSVAAVDFEGKLLWTNREINHYSRHGLGASPIVYQDRLIMAYDGSNRVEVPGDWPNNSDEERLGWQIPWDKARIVAFDVATGQQTWTGHRGMSRVGHATPSILNENGQSQLVSSAGDVIQGFNLDTGAREWTVYSQGEGVVPSIVIGDGLLFTSSGFEASTIRVVRTGGKGNVTESHIAWEQKAGTPRQPSMIYVKPNLYALTDNGVMHCYEAKTGRIVWKNRIGGKHCASPVYADGKIYTLAEDGESAVVQIDPEFKLLAKNRINERCQASMAVANRNLLIRTERNLYCIGEIATE